MNKREYAEVLSSKTGRSLSECEMIVKILEGYFFLDNKNREVICKRLEEELSIDDSEAQNLYDEAIKVVRGEVKRKLTHPFGK